MKKKDMQEDLDIDGRILLKLTLEKQEGGEDRSHLAQDRDQWRVFMKAVMNVRFS
jgi:hypothetical protein